MTSNECPECYASQADIVFWRDLPVNPTIKAYRDAYISPAKQYYPSLDAAMVAWGINFEADGEWL